MVCDYATDGNLRDFLRNQELAIEDKLEIMIQICKGMAYLEWRDIVHRDLRAENLLVNGGQILIADFGLSRTGTYEATNNLIPYRWTAVEVLKGSPFRSSVILSNFLKI
jgi:eukaryotic-like serine/threonine-protein kinase